MLKRFSGTVVLLAAVLIALPACGKKAAAPTVPDSTPAPIPPSPKPTPNTNQGTGTQTPLDPTLPFPPTQKPLFNLAVTTAAIRDTNIANLKQIGLAFILAQDTTQSFPIGLADKSGKVGLSWRVALLPYIEQEPLYREFKLDEPWDSESNKKLISKMPKMYGPARTDTNGYTFYRSFSAKDAFISLPTTPLAVGKVVPGLRGIPDGASNTIIVAEAYDPVIWTKPDDLAFTPGTPPRLGGGVFGTGFCALTADGAARFIPMNAMTPADLSNAIQVNDGKPVNFP